MTDYINIGAMLACICLMASWMFITSRQHYAIKMAASVIAVILSIGIWREAVALIGYPVHGLPPDHSVVLALEVDSSEIAFWIEGKPPRGYVIPYDDDLAKKLLAAQDQARNTGGVMIFHIGEAGKDGGHKPHSGTRIGDDSPPISINIVPAIPGKI